MPERVVTVTPSFPTRERGLKSEDSMNRVNEIVVVPHAGTWIEIQWKIWLEMLFGSFPTRERGLKFTTGGGYDDDGTVVPHAGTWIEMIYLAQLNNLIVVVPHAGTWIEII